MMLDELLRASDDKLLSILAEADALDEVILERHLLSVSSSRPTGDHSLEVVILGSLGCRLGMLRGEAGGFLLRTAEACALVDPGPAAVYLLSRLEMQGQFRFRDLDAILCSHVHTDHTTDLLPCIEGMTGGMRVSRGHVIGNRTVIEKFTTFSPYHLAKVRTTILMPYTTRGEDEEVVQGRSKLLPPSVDIRGGTCVRATPTFHSEEEGKWDTGVGFFIQSKAASAWYTGDTNLFDSLLEYVKAQMGEQRLTLVIANADASDVKYKPGKAEVCHLLTRDVLEIARELKPRYILITHYDEAYSSSRYRIAQAIYLQHLADLSNLKTVILPSANGLHLSFRETRLKDHELYFESDEGTAVREYITALGFP